MQCEERWYQTKGVEAFFNYFNYFRNFNRKNYGDPILALPGGTGKSWLIGMIIQVIFQNFPNPKVMMLTHVKELIEQNAEKVFNLWETAPLGIYSAALKQRDIVNPIIYGGVQSVANEIKRFFDSDLPNKLHPSLWHFGWRDALFVDECHLISPNEATTYRWVIEKLREINPNMIVVGFTATPYRLGQGLLTEGDGSLFSDICYDITDFTSYNRLISEGFLAPLIGKKTGVQIDTSGLSKNRGEYNQNQAQKEVDKIMIKAAEETIYWGSGEDRKSWIVFTSGIENAEKFAAILQSYGVSAVASHSKIDPGLNDEYIRAFKNFEIQALVNNNKYTTGFDHPSIDLMVDLQPTTSTAKHVQKLSRMARPASGKINGRYLGFAGNVESLGPINDPVIPKPPGKGGSGDAPVKFCSDDENNLGCGSQNHPSARFCECCGKEFLFKIKIKSFASVASPLKENKVIYEYHNVTTVLYSKHQKTTREGLALGPPSLKVRYICGLKSFNEWIPIEHPKTKHLVREWWVTRMKGDPPNTVDEALKIQSRLRMPKSIKVLVSEKYPRITGVEWF